VKSAMGVHWRNMQRSGKPLFSPADNMIHAKRHVTSRRVNLTMTINQMSRKAVSAAYLQRRKLSPHSLRVGSIGSGSQIPEIN